MAVGTPLAEALQEVVQPKLVEVGWSTGGDDSALSEYIILMLVNGKTQEQIASELSNDLLGLGPEDSGATDFSRWLFNQVVVLDRQLNGAQEAAPTAPAAAEVSQIEQTRDSEMGGQMAPSEQQDADMDEAADGPAGAMYVPTPPHVAAVAGSWKEKLTRRADQRGQKQCETARPRLETSEYWARSTKRWTGQATQHCTASRVQQV